MAYIDRAMMSALIYIAVAVTLFAIAVGVLATWRGACAREQRLREWTKELGLELNLDGGAIPDRPHKSFAVFTPGTKQKHLLRISGALEFAIGEERHMCPVVLGDVVEVDHSADIGTPWWYQLIAGPTRRRFSYLLVELPFKDIPSMRIRHRRGPGGFGVVSGWEILTTEWVEFNRELQVATRNKRFASNLIAKHMMELLVDHPTWPLTIEGGAILMSDAERVWRSTDYRQSVEWMRAFLALWPEHLVARMAADSPAESSMQAGTL